jgi:hypothetical protein
MLDTYNAGVVYLKEKLGVKEITPTTKRENGKMVITSRNYVYRRENIVPYSTEHSIELLLGQYYYGSAPKRELSDLLTSLGIEHK